MTRNQKNMSSPAGFSVAKCFITLFTGVCLSLSAAVSGAAFNEDALRPDIPSLINKDNTRGLINASDTHSNLGFRLNDDEIPVGSNTTSGENRDTSVAFICLLCWLAYPAY